MRALLILCSLLMAVPASAASTKGFDKLLWGMSPDAVRAAYPDQAQQVLWMMFTAPLTGNSDLVVDATGVGKPVVESVRARRAGGTLRAGLLAEVQAVCRVNA